MIDICQIVSIQSTRHEQPTPFARLLPLAGGVSQQHGGLPWFLDDMLPMLYAPVGGELVARDFAARPLQPSAATLPEWEQARALASTFWQTAAADARVSAGFRTIAADNLSQIRR